MRRAVHASLGRRHEGRTAREVLRLRLLRVVWSGRAGVGAADMRCAAWELPCGGGDDVSQRRGAGRGASEAGHCTVLVTRACLGHADMASFNIARGSPRRPCGACGLGMLTWHIV